MVAQGAAASSSLPATEQPHSLPPGLQEAYQNGNGASSSGQAGQAGAYRSYPEWEAGRQEAGRRVAVLQAQKAASLRTSEGQRPLSEWPEPLPYLSLPGC